MRTIALTLPLLALALATLAPAQDGSAGQSYEKLMQEIRSLEQSLTRGSPMSRVMEVFDQIEKKLEGFIASHPGTEEAQDAKFQLGMLNANISNFDKSRKYLEDYVNSPGNAERTKLGYAYYFLGQTYLNEEKFDEAKRYFSTFIENYGDVNANLLAQAKATIDDIAVLRKLKIGNPPIPFEFQDLQGKKVSLEDYKGKVVLLDFWATWCGPCRREMPSVIKLYNKYHRSGFEIIGISLDSNRSTLEKYLKENRIKWPQYFEGTKWNNSIARKYGVRAIPATFLLDRDGKIRYKSVRGRELARAVRKLLNEK